jgi:hypothetical protein
MSVTRKEEEYELGESIWISATMTKLTFWEGTKKQNPKNKTKKPNIHFQNSSNHDNHTFVGNLQAIILTELLSKALAVFKVVTHGFLLIMVHLHLLCEKKF